MRRDELEAIVGHDVGPIEMHVAALAAEHELPSLAVVQCAARAEEAAPALLDVLHKAASQETLSESEERLLFRGLHILGGARWSEAFAAVLSLLRRPDIDLLLGDAITETLPKIVAGVFDGDAPALFAAVRDLSQDEFVRAALLHAAAFLTWDGKIDREETRRFLELFFQERQAPPGDYLWAAWAMAVALLGERRIADDVHVVFQNELIDPMFMSARNFDTMLAEAEEAPRDAARFETYAGYIEDILVVLQPFTGEHEADDVDDWALDEDRAAPAINPWRDVGRNDPCPCGSGKKFKKCCLG